MKDLLNGYKQYPPLLIEIEPTEGCNLGCSFCGLRGMRQKGTTPWYFMTLDKARQIAKKIAKENWKSRITFCGHGEPTLNPELLEIIKVFRQELPKNKFTMFTNCAGFANGNFEVKSFMKELQDLKVYEMIVDVYSRRGDWLLVNNVLDEYDDYDVSIMGEGNNHPFNNKTAKGKMKVTLFPLEIDNHKAFRNMQNHCGAAAPLDYKREHTICTKLFRELFIRWNGDVCLCCDDFRGQYYIANALDDLTIEELWNHERFQAARIRLFNRDRTFLPCHGCNYPPNKAGFIPDITGGKDKKYMPTFISDEVKEITEQAYNKNGRTTIVKRKWEIE